MGKELSWLEMQEFVSTVRELSAHLDNPRARVEFVDIAATALSDVVDTLGERLAKLEEELSDLKQENGDLKDHISELEDRIVELWMKQACEQWGQTP